MEESDTAAEPRKRWPLRWKLIVPLNAAVVLIIGSFLVWDALSTWNTELDEKRDALQAEAYMVLAAMLPETPFILDQVQPYIDEICERAQKTSPGHHIAVQVGKTVFQARSTHADPAGMLRSMQEAAASPEKTGRAEDAEIVVGSAQGGGISVWVLEHLDDAVREIKTQVVRRVGSILVLGVAIGLVANLLVTRFVERPLRAVVESARRIGGGELGAKVPPSSTEELAVLADEFNAMSAALADADQERRQQMERARQIQAHLQPQVRTVGGLRWSRVYEPANEVGGDYFDIRSLGNGAVLGCVADVTGHGVPAAMGAAVLKTLLIAAAARTADPAGILAAIREGFSDALLDDDFASMIVVVIERDAGRLRYASAGHPPAYLIRQGEPTRQLPATGPLLGIPVPEKWETATVDARPGDRLLLVTDGLMDASCAGGGHFGLERLEALIEELRAEPMERMCRRMMDRIKGCRGHVPQSDDMTLLAIEV